jgi:hypothetical protein
VTGSLSPLVELARAGRIAAAAVDWPEKRARRVEAWSSLLGLLQPLRTGETYVNAGVVALDTARWGRLLERWWEVSMRVPDGSTFKGEIDENPLWAGDQDALNALLMSEAPAGSVHVLPVGTIVFPPDVERVAVRDARALACELHGAPVTMLHYSWVPKPWEARAWTRMQRPAKDAYARLLPRVLFADDAPVRIPRHSVPPWLRGGAAGAVTRRWVAVLRPLRRWAGHARRRILPRHRPPVQRPV